jgi:hypothetical protein
MHVAALSRLRSVSAVAGVVAFNLAMIVLAATASGPVGAPFVATWMAGDFVVCLLGLALTEQS